VRPLLLLLLVLPGQSRCTVPRSPLDRSNGGTVERSNGERARRPCSDALQEKGAHPRLLFRAKASKGVPGLDEIVAKSKQAPWSQRLGDLKETTHGLALHWLITGDEASARACAGQLRKIDPDEGYGLFVQGPVFTLPIAYDWLCGWKGFTDRKAVEAKIAKTADKAIEFLNGDGDHVFHTSAPRALMGIGLAGLALGREDYVKVAMEYLDRTYFPALQHLDCGGVAGPTYALHEGFQPLLFLLWALRSARDIDLFPKIAPMMEYVVHSMLPDLTLVRWGDCVGGSRCGTRDETRGIVDMLARGLESAAGFALSARIAKRWPSSRGYHASVLPTFFVFGREAKEGDIAVPPARLFGEKSIGQAFFRTGWGDEDTVVFFKAGDYYDSHGHYDQGSFTIYRRGHLAVDAGVYSAYDDHRMKFARTTIAHNTLLVGPDDARGSQRIVEGQSSQDVDDHEAKKRSKKFEAADVIAWKVDKDWAYVSADLTAAYDPQFAKLVTRELVWTRAGALVVFDKVETPSRARFLLHSAGDVEIAGQRFVLPGKDASLHGATLLPKRAKLTRVKGCSVDGTEYPAKPAEFGVPGEWRLEVEGGAHFLHVLWALDKGAEAPAAKLVENGDTVGVELGGRRYMFKKAGVSRAPAVK